MRDFVLVALLTAAIGCAHKHHYVVPPQAAATEAAPPDGSTRLVATLDAPVNVGETFYATVQKPLVDDRGNELVPEGAKVKGRVSDLRQLGGGQSEAVLDVDAILIGGEKKPVAAKVTTPPVNSRKYVGGEAMVGLLSNVAVAGVLLARFTGVLEGGAVGTSTNSIAGLAGSTVGGGIAPTPRQIGAETTAPVRIGVLPGR